MQIQIPVYARKALDILTNEGYEAYVVGGCVRDSLLGRTPNDWDITTNALPKETIACFQGYRVIETGLKHGTVTVLIENKPVEITTFRIDGTYSDHRRPDHVTFTASLKEDLSRRDFTVNAMAYHPYRGLQDFFGGAMDLERKKVRCVGNADDRFKEDALRLLRAVRFASVLNFEIEEETSISIHKNKELLNNIASERLISELNKLLCGQKVGTMLLTYRDLFAVFIPELKEMFGFNQHNPHHYYDVYRHTVESLLCVRPVAVLRLALLFHDIAKPECFTMDQNGIGHFYGHPKKSAQLAEKIMKHLKYDNDTINTVCLLIGYHDYHMEPDIKKVRRLLGKIGEDNFHMLLEVQKADVLGQSDYDRENKLHRIEAVKLVLEDVMKKKLCCSIKELAVSGRDLISIGIPQGKELGELLRFLLKKVIDEEVPNQRAILLEEVQKQIMNQE
ncbi:MAG: HD domain-containing protein [Clostridiales bacterium]|nr:HD domain-containing protein [Clostridiales bacterium]